MKTPLAALALLATLSLSAATPANFTGTWTHDAAASKGMPPMFSDIKAWTLTVKQDAKQLTNAVHIENDRVGTTDHTYVYALDGNETTTETPIMTPAGAQQVPTKLQARPGENGTLRITITRDFPMGGDTIHSVVTEDWELSADGKTLTIHRHDDGIRKADMDLVFRR